MFYHQIKQFNVRYFIKQLSLRNISAFWNRNKF